MNSIYYELSSCEIVCGACDIPEIPKLRAYIRKRLLDKKRRMVTKYVTEAFGLLLLTDSFNCTENLPVWMPPGL